MARRLMKFHPYRFTLQLLLLGSAAAWNASMPAVGLPPVPSEGGAGDTFDFATQKALRWRNIGPNRGGRSIAATGSRSRPHEYYFGATGGGLWKTTDGGTTWAPVTDGQIRSSSVGAVAVAESHPDVVYIGMGEAQLRGNVMQGDGVYRSVDAGRTWRHAGLADTQAIARIRVHPTNPDLVYVAALGHPYGPNPERGVFRSRDGGRSWQKILYRNDRTGAVDLQIDPSHPEVLYATLWEVHRKPWILWSGGPGSGIFKSTDGGDTWTELTRNPGLPSGLLGKITVSVSAAESNWVYANIEAGEGGLYRSEDGGKTWKYINSHRDLWQRAFYFLRIQADPKNRETIYVLNFILQKSTDGGKTFSVLGTPHVDHHDLWIDPENPQRMIHAGDGGASVSVNGGRSWTAQRYPTAQIYRVITTRDVPYHVCGAQQDNSTACLPSDGGHQRDPSAPAGDWLYDVGGGENAAIASDSRDPNIFYAGATNTLTRYDRRTGLVRDIQPLPRMVMGEPARDMPERWNWVYPIVLSPLDPGVLYAGSQHLWRTVDEGRTWDKISPDLTRADPETLGDSGGPIVKDQDGPEIYGTIYTIAPSRRENNTLWVGSDDGLVHVTRDGGKSWSNATPPEMEPFTKVAFIEASPHAPGTAFVAGTRYQLDDRRPYLWKTEDYGRSWTRIVDGMRADDFVHAVREDPKRPGLLFAGTEHGVYVSFDDGARWRSLSLNLSDVQVIGLVVEERDLVAATHGRSFYVLDNIEPLRQWTEPPATTPLHLFTPANPIRRLYPAAIDYLLADGVERVEVEILDEGGNLVRRLPNAASESGLHRIQWDLRYPGATVFEGIVLEGANPARGPWAPPGRYQVRVTTGGRSETRGFTLSRDPRLTDVSDADLAAQFALAMQIRDRTSAANEAVIRIREIRRQIEDRVRKGSRDVSLKSAAQALAARVGAIEGELYQVRNQSPKDKIAFPIRLNNRLSGLRGIVEEGDARPTESQHRVFNELAAELEVQLQRLDSVLSRDLAEFSRLLVSKGMEGIPAGAGRVQTP